MTIVKKFTKGYLVWNKYRKYRSMICSIRLVQKFYKRRLKVKHKNAVIVQKFMKGLKKYQKYQRFSKVKEGTINILKWVETTHYQKRAIIKWVYYNMIMKASICIQKAVRKHLKKKRVTMSRTRCVQFFWKKFCRLLKLSSSVKASRLIKHIMEKRVVKILK